MRERLEEQESKRKEAEESYGSLQHEVDSKTKKLAKIWTKLQDAKKDLETMHEDFTEARERVQVCLVDPYAKCGMTDERCRYKMGE